MFLTPIIPRGIRPVIVVILLIGSILSYYNAKQPFRWSNFLLNSSLIFIYAISLIYTEDVEYGIRKISTASTLLIFPLIFSFMSKRCIRYILDKRYMLMWLFIVATVLLCIGAFLKFMTHYSFNDSILHYPNIIRSDLGGWKIHPIYLSMHIGVSVIFSLVIFNKGVNWKRLLCLILLDIILIIFLMIMIKKGPIIALILGIAFLTLVFKNKKLFIISGLVAAVIICTIAVNPKVQSRFAELLQVQNAKDDITSSTNIRYSIYQCAFDMLPDAGLIGYGIGDGKNVLIECFQEQAAFLASHKYNSHNQYLGLVLNVGYLGLILFVVFLLYHMIRAFSRKNYLLIAVVLFYCMVMFSENILERENGVWFFALFVNLFIMLDWNLTKIDKEPTSIDKLIK
ncbi:O-antigen polymerase [Nonlabens arenilitoris]|uniref:O-antigen polymerase n=1 Tax=Nonlabens arenilitoris TaxID=1217969 RepID=A0A2S7UE56_9FLAO|nr:O-antigen polymerase [Nonlabens arenilitoris]